MADDEKFVDCEIRPVPPAAGTIALPWPQRRQYDPRIELVLMRSERRLGVEYRRFILGKLALVGFVTEEPPPSDDAVEAAGENEEFHECDPLGLPKARLERMAKIALHKIAENG